MIAPLPSDDAALRFLSLASLRAAHGELLQRQHTAAPSELRAEVETFLRRGQSTGALLDEDEERWEAQSILDYWATFLFRADRTRIDATLADLDPELAPDLPDDACPFVGLDAFGESRFEVFFGRQRMIQTMVERLATERFLAVVGDSGSGKSSVVLAGLLPALKAGALPGSATWRYAPPLVPGPEPLLNLARALSPAGTAAATIAAQAARLREDPRHVLDLAAEEGGNRRPLVLVVDQFEELFTLCEEEAVRQAFVTALSALIESPGLRHTALLTLRSDYESRVAQLGSFQALFERAQVRVMPLGSAELREAIVRPAELRGLKFEEGVVDALVREILGEPAGLPLLQFTLLKLWEGKARNRVTWEAYRRLGGGRQALARSADEFYTALIPQEQVTVRRILLRMVRTSERLEVTSSRILRRNLHRGGEAPGGVDRVLDKLVAARLVRLTPGETTDEDQFEVAHEALVRNWPKLVEWLEQERTEITARRRLEAKVEEWLRLDKQGGLLDEVQLQEAERWLAGPSAEVLGYHPELPDLVAASREAIEDARRQQEKVREREIRQARVFRSLAAVLALLLLLTVGATGWAWRAQQSAVLAREQAFDSAQELSKVQLQREQDLRLLAERQRNFATLRSLEERKLRKAALAAQTQAENALKELRRQTNLTKAALADANTQRSLAEAETLRAAEALEDLRKQKQLTDQTLERAIAEKTRADNARVEAQAQTELAERERKVTKEALDKLEKQVKVNNGLQELTNAAFQITEVARANRVIQKPQALKLGERRRPLQLGVGISSLQGETGTLCCIVKDDAGALYMLSLASVFSGRIGAPIVQPAQRDGGTPSGDKVAVLTRVGNLPNPAAIARLDQKTTVDIEFPEIGKLQGIETTVYPGDKVRLVGRGSGIVEGTVLEASSRVVVTTIVARNEDLGGAVLSDDGDLVGLLQSSDKLGSSVVRIEPILRDLQVELVRH